MNAIFLNRVLIFLPMLIFVFGIVGNGLNTLIFAKKHMRSSPTLRFLLYLSIADLIVLIMGTSEVLLKSDYSLGLRDSSLFVCNIQKFVSYSSTYVSSFLSIAFNVYTAKIISIISQNNKIHCRKRQIRCHSISYVDLIAMLIVVLVVVFNSHFIFLLKPSYVISFDKTLSFNQTQLNGYPVFTCIPVRRSFLYEFFISHTWTWLDLMIFSVFPFASQSICSVIIVVKLKKIFQGYATRLDLISNYSTRRVYAATLRKNIQIYFMLFSSNLYFLFTMSVFWTWFILEGSKRHEETFESNLKQSLVYTLLYSNNAFGIIFYGLFSRQYRREFAKLKNSSFRKFAK
jgi:hypothetical protein